MANPFDLDATVPNFLSVQKEILRRVEILEKQAASGLFSGTKFVPPGEVSLENGALTVVNFRSTFKGFINLNFAALTTIDTGEINVTQSYHRVETESGDGTDNLDTITGGVEGDILVLRAEDSTHDVVVRDASVGDNIQLAGGANFTLDDADDIIVLIYDGAEWLEISRSTNS